MDIVLVFWLYFFNIVKIKENIFFKAASWCGVYSREAFINISALKCSVYLRAAFDWKNSVLAGMKETDYNVDKRFTLYRDRPVSFWRGDRLGNDQITK